MATSAEKFARLAALRPVRAMAKESTRRPAEEGDLVATILGAQVNRNHYGEHLSIRNWYSSPHFEPPSEATIELLACGKEERMTARMRAALENHEKWLFLDTETTGLAGGTGTYAFLVGLAWWDSGGMQVEQFLMRDFSEEHSVLFELARRIAERPGLITFNGKTFDWPLLENRFTMTRSIPLPTLAAHLDLLHPARALWKLRLGSVKLTDLERFVLDSERLGWTRDEDIASAMIPQYYFDFVRGGSPAPLAGVVRHNQLDLRGLAALVGKINVFLTPELAADPEIHSLDLFGLSRFLNRRGKKDRAHSTCAEAVERGLPPEQDDRAKRELALMAARRGNRQQAMALWKELLTTRAFGVEACERLAHHAERYEKDLARAIEYGQMGLSRIRQEISGNRIVTAKLMGLERRLEARLRRLDQRKKAAGSPPIHRHGKRASSGTRMGLGLDKLI